MRLNYPQPCIPHKRSTDLIADEIFRLQTKIDCIEGLNSTEVAAYKRFLIRACRNLYNASALLNSKGEKTCPTIITTYTDKVSLLPVFSAIVLGFLVGFLYHFIRS